LENKNVVLEMKRILIGLLAVAVVGGMLFSGCVAPPPEAPVTSPEPTPHGTPIPWPTDPNSVFITYKYYDGWAIDYDELTIYADGRCQLYRKIGLMEAELEFTIPPSQLEHLEELMEEANFFHLKSPGFPSPQVADAGHYYISCNAGEGRVGGMSFYCFEVPDALQPILHELKQITKQIRRLISYRRRGGDPYLDTLTIFSIGRCIRSTLESGTYDIREFTISPSQLAHLEELIEDQNFLGLKETYGSPDTDLVEYTISYYPKEGCVKTVSAWTTAIPDALLPIMHELDQIKQPVEVLGSQEMATWEMDFADFTWIKVGSGFNVDIKQSDSYSVNITANENLFDYLEIWQDEKAIYIGLKRANYNYINTRLEATITLPELRRLELDGASRGRISGFSSTKPLLRLESKGASFLEIEAVKAGDTEFYVSDASQITGSIETADCEFEVEEDSTIELTGSGNDAFIGGTGARSIRLADFPIINAEVRLAGVDNATITLSGRLDVRLGGASTLYYSGNPTLGNVNVSDDSRIIKL
jgi:hypothetical protein